MFNKFRIEIRKSGKFGLVQIHHEQFVSWCEIGFFGRELFVKVGNIFSMFDARLKWRLHFSIGNLEPIDSSKETVLANVFLSTRSAAKSFGRKLGQQAFTCVFGFFGHGFRIADVVIRDGSEQFFFIFSIKRRLTDKHFVQKNAVSPPID